MTTALLALLGSVIGIVIAAGIFAAALDVAERRARRWDR